MKKKLLLAGVLAFALGTQANVLAEDGISVEVNGEKVVFDQPPVIENGRTLVPFRAVLEKMGAEVDWDNDTQTVSCKLGEREVSLVINSDKMTVPEGEITLDVPAKIINSRTMVPVRAVSEGLGAQVDWDNDTRTVVVVSEDASEEGSYYVDKEEKREATVDGKVAFTVSATYPELNDNEKVNAAIKADVQARMNRCEKENADIAKDFVAQQGEPTAEWYCDINYEVKTFDDYAFSIRVTEVSYMGGAHPNTTVSGLTYNLQTGEKMTAEDFMENALQKGMDGIKSIAAMEPDQYPFYDEATFKLTDDNFYIEGSELVFVVNPYEIAPYARGVVEYKINLEGI